MRHVWDIVIRLRPTIVAAVLALVILALPSQMLELYLIDIETARLEWHQFWQLPAGDYHKKSFLQFWLNTNSILCAMLAGVLAMQVLWLASVHLLCLAPDREGWSRGRRWLAAGLVVLIALAPVLGVLWGLRNVLATLPQIVPAQEGGRDVAQELRGDLRAYIGVTFGLAALGGAVYVFMTLARLDRAIAWGARFFRPVGLALGISMILVFTVAMVIWPTAAPWVIGTHALVNLFIAALAFVLTWFSDIYRRTGWPVTVMVVAGAFLFATMGWNDNHRIDHKVVTTAHNGLEKNFEAWLLSRADRKWYADRGLPYPVYVVAAEGGGMYAGFHAASWLGDMQDRCRRFAQHIFAISSVSGGSLGAGMFAAMTSRHARNEDFRECSYSRSPTYNWAADRFFARDLLAPLVGAALFPDFIQRLLPLPIKALDRAGALEEAFSVAWDSSAPGIGADGKGAHGLFKQPLHKLWDPKGATPALFLNTTSVAAGSRVTISPLKFQQTSTALHINTVLCMPPSDTTSTVELPLATAISLSARFPWLTPAGWLDLAGTQCPDRVERDRAYLVDGGYFENSGLETAIDIATYMRLAVSGGEHAQQHGIDIAKIRAEFPHGVAIRIIMIFAIDGAASRYISSSAERSGARPGELLPPLQAMLNGRSARTRAVHLHAVEEGDVPFFDLGRGGSQRYEIDPSGDVRFGQDAIHQVWLDGKRFFLPLGWRLSRRSRDTIETTSKKTLAADLVQHELDGLNTDKVKGRRPK